MLRWVAAFCLLSSLALGAWLMWDACAGWTQLAEAGGMPDMVKFIEGQTWFMCRFDTSLVLSLLGLILLGCDLYVHPSGRAVPNGRDDHAAPD